MRPLQIGMALSPYSIQENTILPYFHPHHQSTGATGNPLDIQCKNTITHYFLSIFYQKGHMLHLWYLMQKHNTWYCHQSTERGSPWYLTKKDTTSIIFITMQRSDYMALSFLLIVNIISISNQRSITCGSFFEPVSKHTIPVNTQRKNIIHCRARRSSEPGFLGHFSQQFFRAPTETFH